MNKKIITIFISILIIPLLSSTTYGIIDIDISTYKNNKTNIENIPYQGQIYVYIVEKISRWNMYTNEPYLYSVIDLIIDKNITIEYLDLFIKNITWNFNEAGYPDIQKTNILCFIALYNINSQIRYAFPPSDNPFDAYFIDASIKVMPGSRVNNSNINQFSHSVFCELGTLSGCQSCPIVANILESIHNYDEYPFNYVTLIADKNNESFNRLNNELNAYAYPTCFFDGGDKIIFGSTENESYYKNLIEICGNRDVHDLYLDVSSNWIDNNNLEINVYIQNLEEKFNAIPNIPDISGENSGLTGTAYEYRFISNDPDGDEIYFLINWGDLSNETITGLVPSNLPITISHSWINNGKYSIKAKAIDINGAESDWGLFDINMPKKYYNILEFFIGFITKINKYF